MLKGLWNSTLCVNIVECETEKFLSVDFSYKMKYIFDLPYYIFESFIA